MYGLQISGIWASESCNMCWTVETSGRYFYQAVSPGFLDSENKTKDPISLRSLIFQQYHGGLHTAVTLKFFCGILECEA